MKLLMRAVPSCFVGCVLALLTFSFAKAQPKAPVVAPSSGKALCSALRPADFTKAGVSVSALRQANVDGSDGAYCVYESKAGNVEFDIFFPAGATPAEIAGTETTVLGEVGGKTESVQMAGADVARILTTTDKTASIVVRKGKAVFDINIPKSAGARQQLIELAQMVLTRIKP